ncbi:trace amine-associated receptor 13c-like [Leuresthes tenuis]|uniref:trace amine-associated receptor 13c-like n=1 Tax=Leuresthes tenuis TaxID=355514 RepID=UPI003B5041D9
MWRGSGHANVWGCSWMTDVVASVLFYAVVCWGGSSKKRDSDRLDRLVSSAGSVAGTKLDSLVTVAERRTLDKLLSILDNAHHPLHNNFIKQRSAFSGRLLKYNERVLHFCFPHLSNSSCKKPEYSLYELILLRVILSSISVLTVMLNLLVIISISHYRQLHTPTNILLLSLTVSDFLVGLLTMPGEILRNTACWFLGDLMWSLYNYVTVTITSASIGDMVLISIDRYVAICDPLHYPTRVTERRVKLCVCLCWLCSALYSFLFIKDDLTLLGRHNSSYGECVVFIDDISGTVDLVLIFVLPVTVITVLYVRVFVVAVSQARAMRSHVTTVKLQLSVTIKTKKSELKAARTLGVIMIVFLICFIPYYCVSLVGADLLNSSSTSFVFYMFYFNSCLNPVIYALFYPWFRKAVKLIVTLQILQPGSSQSNIL